jgi:putative PIN family toxin of toxin-antitoxin system
MKQVVLDTNVLLDLFVFNDFRAIHLKQALIENHIVGLATPKTLDEFADVMSRPLFSLDSATQENILSQWRSLAKVLPDTSLTPAPWQCQDPDDQVFVDLAFTSRPCILMSKDNEILKLSSRAKKELVIITDNYTIEKPFNE